MRRRLARWLVVLAVGVASAVIAALFLVAIILDDAQRRSGPCGGGMHGGATVWASSFDGDWETRFGLVGRAYAENASVVPDPAGSGAPVLRVAVPRDPVGASFGIDFKGRFDRMGLRPMLRAHLTYRLYVGHDFDWRGGGKLPGLSGAADGQTYHVQTAATFRPDHTRFTARPMWKAQGGMIGYLYASTYEGRRHESNRSPNNRMYSHSPRWRLPDGSIHNLLRKGQWNTIEQYVDVGSGSAEDGVYRGWVNGQLAIDSSRVRWTHGQVPIEFLSLGTFFGGTLGPLKDEYLYIKDFAIQEAAGAGTVPDQPRPPGASPRQGAPSLADPGAVRVPPNSDQTWRAATLERFPLAGPYLDLLETAASAHGVDVRYLAAIAGWESSFNPNARNPSGAAGLFQFMPGTARAYGVDPLDPASSADGAARYLADLLEDTGGSMPAALARYAGYGDDVARAQPRYVDPIEAAVQAMGGGGTPAPGCGPVPGAEGVTAEGELVNVRGIRVAPSVAPSLEAMLAAAAADGVTLTGSGWRSTEATRAARVRNGCPDIDVSPSSSCRVPTARPGHSMHERGLAIDFHRCASRTTACNRWLTANAARYGWKPLASEPWHWSTTGR